MALDETGKENGGVENESVTSEVRSEVSSEPSTEELAQTEKTADTLTLHAEAATSPAQIEHTFEELATETENPYGQMMGELLKSPAENQTPTQINPTQETGLQQFDVNNPQHTDGSEDEKDDSQHRPDQNQNLAPQLQKEQNAPSTETPMTLSREVRAHMQEWNAKHPTATENERLNEETTFRNQSFTERQRAENPQAYAEFYQEYDRNNPPPDNDVNSPAYQAWQQDRESAASMYIAAHLEKQRLQNESTPVKINVAAGTAEAQLPVEAPAVNGEKKDNQPTSSRNEAPAKVTELQNQASTLREQANNLQIQANVLKAQGLNAEAVRLQHQIEAMRERAERLEKKAENVVKKHNEETDKKARLQERKQVLEQNKRTELVNKYLERTGMTITEENLPDAMSEAAELMRIDLEDEKNKLRPKERKLLQQMLEALLAIIGAIAKVGVGTGTELAKKSGALEQFAKKNRK